MSFELDDLWLDKMEGLTSLNITQKRRLYRVIMVCVAGFSYMIDTLFLSLFSMAGTLESTIPLFYGSAALGHIVLFSAFQWSGFSERFANPHMTAWQMTYAISVQIICIAITPQLTLFFLGLMFIIFSFGTLRVSLRQTLIIWLLTCIAIAATLGIFPKPSLGIINPNTWEVLLVGISFATVLLRTIGLGYYATALRLRMYEKSHSLAQAATYDTLTGAINRSIILPLINEHINLCQRKGIISSIAMIDIDNFKNINDTFGHLAGDKVLKKMTQHINTVIRETDKLCRYGGEEFLLLLPVTSMDEGMMIMERIRNDITLMSWQEIAEDIIVTISCGIATIRPSDTVEESISRADHALYDAKKKGKNRVCKID